MRNDRDERLVVVTADPFNAETPLDEQAGVITPNAIHYVRDHFAVPRWTELTVDGAVDRPLRLSIDDLGAMPTRALVVTLECAGNGRAFLDPPVAGEQWGLGAVGTAEWTGVPLRHVLESAHVQRSAVEIVFGGADHGTVARAGVRYERSLPLERALHDDVLLAMAMNGEPLPADHGAPLRLVVPGSYGMASVKWLARVAATEQPFRGLFQADRYVIDGEPLPAVAPRALITHPREGSVIAGRTAVRGYCWSGRSPIARVEVSADGGRTWRTADIEPARSPYSWRRWTCSWEPSAAGDATLVARAWTADGEAQPLEPRRTALGYMNNAARPRAVRVSAPGAR